MRRRVALWLALLCALVTTTTAVAAPTPAPAAATGPSVVVALADTGVNPYHEVFRRPGMTSHPCTWVTGFTDCSIPALRLSIGKHKDYAAAVAADRAVWESVEPQRWYWIPGTNIIGAVCDTERGGGALQGRPDPTCILDDHGHGTWTASSVLSEAPDALLLIHDGKGDAAQLATAPVMPDVQSHSWGPLAPVPLHATDPVTDDDLCNSAFRHPETLFFLAAGNETPVPTLADCSRQQPDVHVVGGSYPGHWNYNSWSTYDFASWYCRPVAEEDSVTATDERQCGTSFSAPTAAGAAALALQRVREHDRYLGRSTASHVSTSVTREAFVAALRDGASYTPRPQYAQPLDCTEPLCLVGWTPMPEQAPYLFWGYGWLDGTVADAVVSCALRRSCPAKSAEARAYNERRQALRGATDQEILEAAPQQDAGSARDAGEDRATALPVLGGKTYDARLEPYVLRGDAVDWFTFRARQGQRISVTATASLRGLEVDPELVGCWVLLGPDGSRISPEEVSAAIYADHCDNTRSNPPPQQVEAPATGTYVLVYSAHLGFPPQDYRFSLSLES